MVPGYGRYSCHHCQADGEACAIHLSEWWLDGDQDRPICPALPTAELIIEPGVGVWIESGNKLRHIKQPTPPATTQDGLTRYWGLIAYHRTRRRQWKGDKMFWGLLAILIALIITFSSIIGYAAAVWMENDPIPQPVVRHQPSDLDKGPAVPGSQRWDRENNPGKYELPGESGPQGPPGVP